jgi:hypothetical protein
MDAQGIFLIIFILILLYIILKLVYSGGNAPISTLQDGTTMSTITPTSLAGGTSGANSGNFTYSVWFYVNDWNYRYGEPKVILGRMGSSSGQDSGSVPGISGNDPCPAIILGAVQNDLSIAVACYPGANILTDTTSDVQPSSVSTPSSVSGTDSVSATNSVVNICNVANIPVQKWVNLLISAYGRSMDVYIDGKLVKTCLLPGIAKINYSAPIYITPNGGFSGWTSKIQYWPNATDPQTAWNIYSEGYGAGASWNMAQYKVKLAVYNGNTETGSISI